MLTGGATESPATIQLADDSNGWDGGRRPAGRGPTPSILRPIPSGGWKSKLKGWGQGWWSPPPLIGVAGQYLNGW